MISVKTKTVVKPVESSFVKNRADYFFTINSDNKISTSNLAFAVSDCNRVRLYIDGVIYNNNEQQLIEGFLNYGPNYINQVEGSFIVFLILDAELSILTDKLNTRRGFYGYIDGSWYISNNIDSLPKDKCRIGIGGLASYIANGVMLNELTIFEEIKYGKRACIHTFRYGKVSIHNYWNLAYTYVPGAKVNEEELQKELEHLLVESIRARIATVENPGLSLSAGYDARGILGIIRNYLNVPNILCFSYSLPHNKNKTTDPVLAKEIAKKTGYPHEVFESYKGNLLEHLINNAREGKCLTNFCEELNTWHKLANEHQLTDVFCGDECFGYFDVPVDSKEKILGIVAISGPEQIAGLKQYIRKDLYDQLGSSLSKIGDEIYQKTENITEPHDKKDYLYIDQRLTNVLMPWRQNICGQVGFVHNPYLDSKILEFIMKLPPELRLHKVFFKKTIRKMMPELFSIELAKTGGYSVDWQVELSKNQDALIDFINKNDSVLDDVISKEEVIRMIRSQCSFFQRTKKSITRTIFYLRKKNKWLDSTITFFAGSSVNPLFILTFPDLMLLRILLIRTYLLKKNI